MPEYNSGFRTQAPGSPGTPSCTRAVAQRRVLRLAINPSHGDRLSASPGLAARVQLGVPFASAGLTGNPELHSGRRAATCLSVCDQHQSLRSTTGVTWPCCPSTTRGSVRKRRPNREPRVALGPSRSDVFFGLRSTPIPATDYRCRLASMPEYNSGFRSTRVQLGVPICPSRTRGSVKSAGRRRTKSAGRLAHCGSGRESGHARARNRPTLLAILCVPLFPSHGTPQGLALHCAT